MLFPSIHVMEIHVVQMPFVEFTIIKRFVHVFPIILVDRQIVVLNVLWMKIVPQIWHAYAINAKAHVMEHADQMLTVRFFITKHTVFVMKALMVIHLAVVNTFYVRFYFILHRWFVFSSLHSIIIHWNSFLYIWTKKKQRWTYRTLSPITLRSKCIVQTTQWSWIM